MAATRVAASEMGARNAAKSLACTVSFIISANTSRFSVHSLDGKIPFDVNVGMQDIIKNCGAVDFNSPLAAAALQFDDLAIVKAMRTARSNAIAVSPSSFSTLSVNDMKKEFQAFVTLWLFLREVEKKGIRENRAHCTAANLNEIAARCLVKTVDSAAPVFERYLAGADFRSDDPSVCSWCGGPTVVGAGEVISSGGPPDEKQAREHFFCSKACHDNSTLRISGATRKHLFAIERGTCQICHRDAHALFKKVEALEPAERLNALLSYGGEGENAFRVPATNHALQRLLNHPREDDFWQADHIIPVAEGGGGCGLDNLRTLCTTCHRKETQKLNNRLKLSSSGGVSAAKGSLDIRTMLGAGSGDKKEGLAMQQQAMDDNVEMWTAPPPPPAAAAAAADFVGGGGSAGVAPKKKIRTAD